MSTGRIQHFGFAAGGAAPAFVYKGIITGGNHNLKSEPIPMLGIGSYKPLATRPGLASGGGSVDFDVNSDMKALLASYGIRSSGNLAEVGIHCGDSVMSVKHLYAMSTGFSLKAEAKGKLTGSFSWLTRNGAEAAGAQTQSVTSTGETFLWYEFGISGITGLEIRSFDISVRHKVELDALLSTPAAGVVRFADAFTDAGQEYIDLKMTLRKQPTATHLPLADALAAIASVVITFTAPGVADTCVITLSNCWLTNKNEDFSPAAISNKGLEFQAEDITVA